MSFVLILTKKSCNIFFITTLLLLLGSCSAKVIRVLSSAELKEDVKHQTIDYKSPLGFVILPVRIDNNIYHFLFDTGAQTSVVSEEFSQKLGIKPIGNINTEDSQKNKKKLAVGVMGNISIGNTSYTNVGVIISDFKENKSFSCLEIDGILGMNVIKLNNWNINYDDHTFTLYDYDYENLLQDLTPVSFHTNNSIPYVDLYVNGNRQKFMVDTGKNGDEVSISSKIPISNIKQVFFGYSSLGLFGKSDVDTIKYALANLTDSSEFIQDDVIISQSVKNKALIGTGFFEERCHSVFFDFKKSKIYLKQKTNISKKNRYPFSVVLTSDGAMIVSAIELGFTDFNIGDTIVAVNEVSFNQSNSCSLVSEMWETRIKGEVITLSILRNNKITKVSLPKE